MKETDLYKAAASVVRALHEAGHEAFFAGGCVRDLVMGAAPADIDIATSATPDEVTALFPGAILVGAQFGVVIVRRDGRQFEVATFRADETYEDGRHPTAVRFTDAEHDVRRRDFTINGMFFDPVRETVIDTVGGRADIERKVVRAIGDPAARFAEDRLRMLRAVRFAARLAFEIEPATAAAIRAHAGQITDVSWERIGQELERQLVDPSRARALRLMDDLDLLDPILPEIAALKGVVQGKRFHPEGDAFDHTVLVMARLRVPPLPPRERAGARVEDRGLEQGRPSPPPSPPGGEGGRAAAMPWPLVLGALLHDIGKAPTFVERDGRITFYEHDVVGEAMARQVCHRLRQSRRTTETVAWLVRRHMAFLHVREMRPVTLKRLMRHEHFPLLLEVFRADALASGGDVSAYESVAAAYRDFLNEPPPTEPLVTGHDLIAMGLEPGPEFGRILQEIEDAHLEGRVTTRDEALALARRLAGG